MRRIMFESRLKSIKHLHDIHMSKTFCSVFFLARIDDTDSTDFIRSEFTNESTMFNGFQVKKKQI